MGCPFKVLCPLWVTVKSRKKLRLSVWLTHPNLITMVKLLRAKSDIPEMESLVAPQVNLLRINEVLRKDWTWCFLCGVAEAVLKFR